MADLFKRLSTEWWQQYDEAKPARRSGVARARLKQWDNRRIHSILPWVLWGSWGDNSTGYDIVNNHEALQHMLEWLGFYPEEEYDNDYFDRWEDDLDDWEDADYDYMLGTRYNEDWEYEEGTERWRDIRAWEQGVSLRTVFYSKEEEQAAAYVQRRDDWGDEYWFDTTKEEVEDWEDRQGSYD